MASTNPRIHAGPTDPGRGFVDSWMPSPFPSREGTHAKPRRTRRQRIRWQIPSRLRGLRVSIPPSRPSVPHRLDRTPEASRMVAGGRPTAGPQPHAPPSTPDGVALAEVPTRGLSRESNPARLSPLRVLCASAGVLPRDARNPPIFLQQRRGDAEIRTGTKTGHPRIHGSTRAQPIRDVDSWIRGCHPLSASAVKSVGTPRGGVDAHPNRRAAFPTDIQPPSP